MFILHSQQSCQALCSLWLSFPSFQFVPFPAVLFFPPTGNTQGPEPGGVSLVAPKFLCAAPLLESPQQQNKHQALIAVRFLDGGRLLQREEKNI